MLIGVLILWVMSMGPVFYFSGIKGIPLGGVGHSYPTMFNTAGLETASWLALAAVLVVAIGIRVALYRVPPIPIGKLRDEIARLDSKKLLLAYGTAYAFNFLFGGGNLLGLGGLAQAAIAITLVRWAFFFLLACAVLVQRWQYHFLILAILIEISLGLLGFWGSFKDFFFIFAIAYVAARPRVTGREASVIGGVFLIVFTVGLFWQAIKGDYRSYLTGGQAIQGTQVTMADEIRMMGYMLETTRGQDLIDALDHTVERICVNTFFFGEVVNYIPEYRPYDGGAGWRAGIEHVFKPRFFFPDKPVLDASEITNRYTAHEVAGVDRGTSFAIGYFGESYADFGPVWMFAPIFLVGLMLGLMYRLFIVKSRVKIMGFAFATAFLPARIGGLHDVPMMLGSTITDFVVMAVLMYLFGHILYKWFQQR